MKNHHFLIAFSLLAVVLIIRTFDDTAAPMAPFWLVFALVVLPVWLLLLWKDSRSDTPTPTKEKSVLRYLIYSYIILVYGTWFFSIDQSRNTTAPLFNLLCRAVWVPGFEIVLIVFILVFVYRDQAKKTITVHESVLEHTCRELLKAGDLVQAIQLLRHQAKLKDKVQLQNDLVVLSASRVFTQRAYQNKKIPKEIHDEYLADLGSELLAIAAKF